MSRAALERWLPVVGYEGLYEVSTPVCSQAVAASLAGQLDDYWRCIRTLDERGRDRSTNALCAMPESNCLALILAETSQSSSQGWKSSGMGGPTGSLTLSTSEWPSVAVVCSLSQVLETGNIPPKYFLTPRACSGILRRAAKRGRKLPPHLREALTQATKEDT